MGQAECACSGGSPAGEQHPSDSASWDIDADNTGHTSFTGTVNTEHTVNANGASEEGTEEVCSVPTSQLCK